MRATLLLLASLFLFAGSGNSQSVAAIQKMGEFYSQDQIQDMQKNDPGKYQSMVWYYSNSWKINQNGVLRNPTEAEIVSMNIKAYDNQRRINEPIEIFDSGSGMTLVLLSAEQCWQELATVLDPADWKSAHDKYLFNKSQRESVALPKNAGQ